jgi:aminopeptidase N
MMSNDVLHVYVQVYSKGQEICRMYEMFLGIDGFRKGMDLYFERHDGKAVTCDDFRAAMADANGIADGFAQFEEWYLLRRMNMSVSAEGFEQGLVAPFLYATG